MGRRLRAPLAAVLLVACDTGGDRPTVPTDPGPLSAAIGATGPTVLDVTPANGPTAGGTSVTLTGTNFGVTPTVTFGGVAARIDSRSHTGLVVTSPAGTPGSEEVRVTVAGQISNDRKFVYEQPPQILSMEPREGETPGGTVVTISGSRFGTAPAVLFGTEPAAVLESSPTLLIVKTPAGEGVVQVVVKSAGAISNAEPFWYAEPDLRDIAPSSGPAEGGTLVTINGFNFGLAPTVTFGTVSAEIVSATHTQLVVKSPPGGPGSTVEVLVWVAGLSSELASEPGEFTYESPPHPVITALFPEAGPTAGGTHLTIAGSNFGATLVVLFGGVVQTIVSGSDTHLLIVTPEGQGFANVQVKAGGMLSNAVAFRYDGPVVASLSPGSGPTAGGTSVTISGANFGLQPTVTFGGVSAAILSVSHETVVVKSPPGIGEAAVVVTVASQASNEKTFAYVCPEGTVLEGGQCVAPPPTPAELVELLVEQVASLPTDLAGSLGKPLGAAENLLLDTKPANDAAACGQVSAFANQVRALLRSGRIDSATGTALLDDARDLLGALGCR